MNEAAANVPVSVVLNTFNRVEFLQRAWQSIVNQQVRPCEVVIVDDGSTDGTAEFLATLDDPRVEVVRHQNMGLTASRNAGARRATGEWITFLDDDDVVDPGWLEQLFSKAAPNTGIVFCGHTPVTPEGRELERCPPWRLGAVFFHHVGSYLPGTWMMRRSIFDDAGRYLDGLPSNHQYELLLRAVRTCAERSLECAAVEEPLLRYTTRSNVDRPMQWPQLALDGGRWILARHARVLADDRAAAADLAAVIGVAAARCGRFDIARRNLARSVRHQPRSPKRWMRLALAVVPPLGRRVWGRGRRMGNTQPHPLPKLQQLPPDHLEGEDHLFLPWRYRRNPQASSDSVGTSYWAAPSENNPLYQEPVYRMARRMVRRRPGSVVVDVGCGSGVKLARIRRSTRVADDRFRSAQRRRRRRRSRGAGRVAGG